MNLLGLSREEVKALPMSILAARHGGYGSLTILSIPRPTLFTNATYEHFALLKRAWRELRGADPVRAAFVEHVARRAWSRLVDRADGYWLQHIGKQVFNA